MRPLRSNGARARAPATRGSHASPPQATGADPILRALAPRRVSKCPSTDPRPPAGAAAPSMKHPPDRAPGRGDTRKDQTMGRITGDKSRFNKQRRQKIAKREEMRALRASWGTKAAAPAKKSDAK